MIFPVLSVVALVLSVGLGAEEEEVVKVSTIQIEPYATKTSSGEYKGFVPDLLEKIFGDKKKYTLDSVRDGQYGSQDSQGNWNGLVGQLTNKETHLVAAPLTVTDARKTAIEFTKPFMKFHLAILMRKEDQEEFKIDNFEDLANQKELSYGVLKSGSTHNFFKTSKKEIFKRMHNKMEEDKQGSYIDNTAKGVDKIRRASPKWAFIMEAPTAKFIAGQKPCDLVVIETNIDEVHYAFAVQQGDEELKKKVNDKLAELGDMEELKKKWWNTDCSAGHKITITAGLAVVLSLFYLFF